jgi:uncharacterized protein YegJ (DUF2314 family)
MKRSLVWGRIAVVALAIGFGWPVSAQNAQPQDQQVQDHTIGVSSDDAAMSAAIAKAQATLDDFLKVADHPPEGTSDFALKVKIADGDKVEHFWVIPFSRKGDGFTGTIADKPELVMTVSEGQAYDFPRSDISDWMYTQNGKIHGGQTIRALLPHMKADEAARVKAMLADE